MSSLFTDTIRKTGGTAGVDIRVKNTSVYETDNSTSNTQNLVQSLVKVWFTADASCTPAFNDSFNCSSLEDVDTGKHRPNYTIILGEIKYIQYLVVWVMLQMLLIMFTMFNHNKMMM